MGYFRGTNSHIARFFQFSFWQTDFCDG